MKVNTRQGAGVLVHQFIRHPTAFYSVCNMPPADLTVTQHCSVLVTVGHFQSLA